MPGNNLRAPYNEQVQDEATEWFVRFCEQEVDGPSCQEFDAWLRRSPEHIRAYLDISALWDAAGSMTRNRRVDIEEMVRRARAESNVVVLDQSGNSRAGAVHKPRARRLRLAIAAAVFFFCLACGAALWWQQARYPTYATRTGEQRIITLSDGSTVELNARSRIKVRFTQATRAIELIEGQALFHVARNPARPFVVASGTTRVRAVGTQFDVYKKSTGTVVTVVEGKVAVSAPETSGTATASTEKIEAVLLSAGEQVIITSHSLPVPTYTNPSVSTAWTRGNLVFDSTPLSEVIQEFARYNARPLFIDDPKLLALHISGTFPTTDSAQFVNFLAQRFGLVVHETDEGTHLDHD
jgi:transmembrane sensor